MSLEAWKNDGKCHECRRKDYCKTECSARKRRVRAIITAALALKATPKMRVYDEIGRFEPEDADTIARLLGVRRAEKIQQLYEDAQAAENHPSGSPTTAKLVVCDELDSYPDPAGLLDGKMQHLHETVQAAEQHPGELEGQMSIRDFLQQERET